MTDDECYIGLGVIAACICMGGLICFLDSHLIAGSILSVGGLIGSVLAFGEVLKYDRSWYIRTCGPIMTEEEFYWEMGIRRISIGSGIILIIGGFCIVWLNLVVGILQIVIGVICEIFSYLHRCKYGIEPPGIVR